MVGAYFNNTKGFAPRLSPKGVKDMLVPLLKAFAVRPEEWASKTEAMIQDRIVNNDPNRVFTLIVHFDSKPEAEAALTLNKQIVGDCKLIVKRHGTAGGGEGGGKQLRGVGDDGEESGPAEGWQGRGQRQVVPAGAHDGGGGPCSEHHLLELQAAEQCLHEGMTGGCWSTSDDRWVLVNK